MARLRITAGLGLLALALALAGCAQPATAPAPSGAAGAGPAGVPSAARAACRAAVDRQTDQAGARIVAGEAAAGRALVTLRDPRDDGDWRCLVSEDGRVAELSFAADPGAGTAGAPGAAGQACLAAVADATGEGDVRVLSSATAAAGTRVTVGVGPGRTPWRCTAYPDGRTGRIARAGAS